MSGRRRISLAGAWLSAAALASCGQAFSAGTGTDGGAGDAAYDVAPDQGASGPDAGPEGAPAEGGIDASHGDATGVPDAVPPADGAVGKDAPAGPDAVVVDAVAGDATGKDAGTIPPKRVFVTSNASSGNLGGLAGADGICQDLASKAQLDGQYKAWLSSTTTSAASRLTHVFAQYVLVNGVVVANGWDGLTSGTLLAPIDVDEKGGPAPTQSNLCGETNASVVWTSTAIDGSLGTTQGATCDDWTGVTGGAVLGFADRTDAGWTAGCAAQGPASTICTANAALYCIEQ